MLRRALCPTALLLHLLFLAGDAERHAVRPHAPSAGAPAAGRGGDDDGAAAAAPPRWGRRGPARLLTAALFASARASVAQAQADAAAAADYEQALDTNGDGAVDHDEFLALLPEGASEEEKGAAERLRSLYEHIFSRGDIDGDGSLSPAELDYAEHLAATAIRSGAVYRRHDSAFDLAEPAAEKLLGEMDLNGDGTIDREEYNKALLSYAREVGWGADATYEDPELEQFATWMWERADTTGDGRLDVKELQFASMLLEDALQGGIWLEKSVGANVQEFLLQEVATNQLDMKLTKEEVAAALERRASKDVVDTEDSRQMAIEKCRDLFDEFDADKDGSLAGEEFAKLSQRIARDALALEEEQAKDIHNQDDKEYEEQVPV